MVPVQSEQNHRMSSTVNTQGAERFMSSETLEFRDQDLEYENGAMGEESSLYEIMSTILMFSNEDQLFWWYTVGPLLNDLLVAGGYSAPLQREYLSYFEEDIMPLLGPRPASSREELALAVSCSFQQASSSSVRLTLNPILGSSGFSSGISGEGVKESFVLVISEECGYESLEPLDLGSFDSLADSLLTQDVEAKDSNGDNPFLISITFDFDIEGFHPIMSASFLQPHQSLCPQSGNLTTKNTFSLIDQLSSFSPELYPSMALLAKYVSSPGSHATISTLTVQYLSPITAAIEIQLHSSSTLFSSIREIYTLGGTFNSRYIWSGLQVLEDLWAQLFHAELPTPPYLHEDEFFATSNIKSDGISVDFKFAPGENNPEIGVKIPITVVENDISAAFTKFAGYKGISGMDRLV